MKTVYNLRGNEFEANHLPMRRHVAQPLHAGGLVGRVGLAGAHVNLAGDGLVDEGLLLLFQQRHQLLLGADVAPDAPVGVVEEADDGGLFAEGWNWCEPLVGVFAVKTRHCRVFCHLIKPQPPKKEEEPTDMSL